MLHTKKKLLHTQKKIVAHLIKKIEKFISMVLTLKTASGLQKKISTSGNRTRGVCVTGRNVTNYTNTDRLSVKKPSTFLILRTPILKE